MATAASRGNALQVPLHRPKSPFVRLHGHNTGCPASMGTTQPSPIGFVYLNKQWVKAGALSEREPPLSEPVAPAALQGFDEPRVPVGPLFPFILKAPKPLSAPQACDPVQHGLTGHTPFTPLRGCCNAGVRTPKEGSQHVTVTHTSASQHLLMQTKPKIVTSKSIYSAPSTFSQPDIYTSFSGLITF